MKYLYSSLLASLLLLLSFTSCSLPTCQECGQLVSSFHVNRQFRELQILPDHRYFYAGEILEPDAIIGIHRDFSLVKGFWTEINLTQKQLEKWMWTFSAVEGIYDEDDRMTIYYEGSNILSPDGRQVGIYYSKYHETVVKFPGNDKIQIYKPDPPFSIQMIRIRNL